MLCMQFQQIKLRLQNRKLKSKNMHSLGTYKTALNKNLSLSKMKWPQFPPTVALMPNECDIPAWGVHLSLLITEQASPCWWSITLNEQHR